MVGVYPHVHLSHISGHFPSNLPFQYISGHFQSIFVRISRQMHYSRASQGIFVQYGKHIRRIFWKIHTEDISEIHIWDFFQNKYWGDLCLPM